MTAEAVRMYFALLRKKPVERMMPSISSCRAAAMRRASGYFLNSAGVTMLTRASVHWADRIVAMSNSKAP